VFQLTSPRFGAWVPAVSGPTRNSVRADRSVVQPDCTHVSNASPNVVVDGSTVTGNTVAGSAKNAASGVTRSSTVDPRVTTSNPTGAWRR